MKKTIYLGSDHAGFALKEKIKRWLIQKNIRFEDLGNTILNPDDDYPDFAEKVARHVAQKKSLGVLCCGSSQGVCVTSNKIKDIRAVAPYNLKESSLAREHLNANIICLSGWYTPLSLATKMIHVFLTTRFSGAQRHVRRINKIQKLEQRRM